MTNLIEGFGFRDYKIPDDFKRVVVGFLTDSNPCFSGLEFYDSQGVQLLSVGSIKNKVETILDDDERIVGIASRIETESVTDF